MCKTFKLAECGHHKQYALYIIAALLPAIFLRKLAYVGWVSLVVLLFTFSAIAIIIWKSSEILSKSPAEVRDEYHIPMADDDRQYNYWVWEMLPIFCATMLSLFEGNQ